MDKKVWRLIISGVFLITWLLFLGGYVLLAQESSVIKVGEVSLGMSASLSLKWTDNVGLNELNKNVESDWSATANIGINLRYPLTKMVEFGLDATLGYTRWADHDYVSSGLVGSSALSFDFPLAGWKLNLHDRYTRAVDPIGKEIPFVDNVLEYARTTNTLGISGLREFNKLKFSTGYDLISYRTEGARFKQLSRDSHCIFADLAAEVNPKVDLFTRLEHEETDNRLNLFNDSLSDRIELGFRGRITPRLSGEVAVGYQTVDFKQTSSFTTDTSDFEGTVYRTNITHRLTSLTTQALDFNYQPEYGYALGNYYKWYNVSYRLNHKFTPRLTGNISFAYDNLEESGVAKSPSIRPEEANRKWFGLGTSYLINPRTALDLAYSFVTKDSNLAGKEYDQNSLTLTLTYHF